MAGLSWDRRRFLKVLGTTAAAVGLSDRTFGEAAAGVCVVADSADVVVAAQPAAWALERLMQALKVRGVAVTRAARLEDATSGSLYVVAAGAASPVAMGMLREARSRWLLRRRLWGLWLRRSVGGGSCWLAATMRWGLCMR